MRPHNKNSTPIIAEDWDQILTCYVGLLQDQILLLMTSFRSNPARLSWGSISTSCDDQLLDLLLYSPTSLKQNDCCLQTKESLGKIMRERLSKVCLTLLVNKRVSPLLYTRGGATKFLRPWA